MPDLGLITFAIVLYAFTKEVFKKKKPPSIEEQFGKAFKGIVKEAINESKVMKGDK